MDYNKARAYLEKVNIYGSVLGLDSIKQLLGRLGNPEKELKVVHVAGTNGKGSVITFIQSILMEAGYKVGRYSSPAVFDYREIIKVNDEMISQEEVAGCISKIKKVCDEMVKEGCAHPTPFEIETAMAFMHLNNAKCDICLIECGMGGETDATNVFENVLCSVITSVSLDHMQFLGNTTTKIAAIKGGIIKDSCPVVVASQEPDVLDVFYNIAKEKNTTITVANPINDNYVLKMLGTYQYKNAGVALEVANVLEKYGYSLNNHIKQGLEKAVWPGRMEEICSNPLFIIDGAHNPAAVKELVNSIDLYFTNKRIAFIMGVLGDKDFEKEVQIICEKATHIITITPDNPRALDGKILKDVFLKHKDNVTYEDTLESAVNKVVNLVENNQTEMIIAFGSLSYLGKLKNIVLNRQ